MINQIIISWLIKIQLITNGHGNMRFCDIDKKRKDFSECRLMKRIICIVQMFTNGMSESISSKVYLRDISPEAFKGMLEFMYNGELNLKDTMDFGSLLFELLLMADQFGVSLLHQECCKILLKSLSEVVL